MEMDFDLDDSPGTPNGDPTLCQLCNGDLQAFPLIPFKDPFNTKIVGLRCGHSFHDKCLYKFWELCAREDETENPPRKCGACFIDLPSSDVFVLYVPVCGPSTASTSNNGLTVTSETTNSDGPDAVPVVVIDDENPQGPLAEMWDVEEKIREVETQLVKEQEEYLARLQKVKRRLFTEDDDEDCEEEKETDEDGDSKIGGKRQRLA